MKNHLIILLLFISLFGCRSKQKTVNREREKQFIEHIEKLNQQIFENFKTDSVVNSAFSTLTTSEDLNIDLIQADSSKTITITMPDGKKTTIKGANVKLIKQAKTTQTNDTTSIHLKKETDKNTLSESQSNKITKTETKKRATETHIKGGHLWWVWVLIIILALAAYRLRKFIF